jgi:hypothetical protein
VSDGVTFDLRQPAGTPSTCAQDCHVCGDGFCTDPFEPLNSCPLDCHMCGDGTCSSPFETFSTCPQDCPPQCPDSVCSPPTETVLTCPARLPDLRRQYLLVTGRDLEYLPARLPGVW